MELPVLPVVGLPDKGVWFGGEEGDGGLQARSAEVPPEDTASSVLPVSEEEAKGGAAAYVEKLPPQYVTIPIVVLLTPLATIHTDPRSPISHQKRITYLLRSHQRISSVQ